MTRSIRLVSILALAALPLAAGDWPRWGGGQDCARLSAETGHGVPTPAWTFALPAGFSIYASPAIDDGRVIFGANDGTIRALDAANGAPIWSFTTRDVVISSAAVHRGWVYVGGRDGRLYCLRSTTGEVLWETDLGGEVNSSPAVDDARIYVSVGFPSERFVALDRLTGAVVWSVPAGQTTSASPAMGAGRLYVAADDGDIIALDPATGAEVWRHSTAGTPSLSSPMFQGSTVYLAAGGHDLSLYAHDAATGTHAWVTPCSAPGDPPSTVVGTCPQQPGQATRVRAGTDHKVSSPAFVPLGTGDVICTTVSLSTLNVYAVRVTDGSIAWIRPLGATSATTGFSSSVASAGGLLFVGSEVDGRLYVLDPAAGGSVLGWVDIGAPIAGSPAVANGRVYVGTTAGVLFALDSPLNRAPDPPSQATFAPAGSIDVPSNTPTISWGDATDPNPGGDPPAGLAYRLRYDFDGEVDEDWVAELASAVGVPNVTVLAPIPNGSHVWYRVRTRDSNGAESPWSGVADFFVNRDPNPPLPASELLALPRDGAADLSWVASPSSDVRFYNVTWDTGSMQVPGTQTSVSLNGLVNFTTYACSVVAEDFDGLQSPPAVDSVTPRPIVSLNGVGYATVQDALDASVGGDEVILGAERFVLGAPLRMREGVSLRGFSALHTVLDGPGTGTIVSVERTNGAAAAIHDLLLRDGDLGIDARGVRLDVHHVVIVGCVTGVRVMSGAVVRAWNVTLTGNSGTAFLGTGGALAARNNAVVRNGGRGFDDAAGLFTGTYNDVFGNTGGNYVGMAPGTGDLSEDVTFLAPASDDYREPPGAAVVDSGDFVDPFVNEPQPNGNRINQGAFGNTRFAARSLSYTVSGATTQYGAPLPGIALALTGQTAGNDTTDAGGAYDFPGLFRGPYTVTPTTPGFKYVPPSRTFDLREEMPAQDFAAFPRIYTVSGTVLLNGLPFTGAAVSLTGDETASAMTDGNGDYAFSGLPDGNYVVAPQGGTYGFAPASRAVTIAAASVPGQDFTATLLGPPVVSAGGVYYPTIDAAIAAVPPGTMITLFAGTYAGPVTLPGGISIEGVAPHQTVIDGGGAVRVVQIGGSSVLPPTTLRNLRVTGGTVGIEVGTVPGDSPQVFLEHVIVSRTTGDAVHGGSGGSLTASFVTIANNGGDGIDAALASSVVRDSIAARNGGVGVRNSGGAGTVRTEFTCISSNAGGAWAGPVQNTVWHQGPPRFVNEASEDYQSLASCPTIDRANPASPFGAEPSPNGGRANQGAFGDTSFATRTPGGDAIEEIALSGGTGSGGWVHLLSNHTLSFRPMGWSQLPWTAYDAADGAVHPALGDVDGVPGSELVLGTTSGGWIAVMHHCAGGNALLRWVRVPWTPYDASVGVTWPACGDVDGDGRDEIIVGLGPYPTSGGWAVVFDDMLADFARMSWIRLPDVAYDLASGETRPACGDVDGDGRDEVVLATGRAQGLAGFARVFDDAAAGFAPLARIDHPDALYRLRNGELWPAVGDFDGNGRSEVALGPGVGGGGLAWLYGDAAGGFAPGRAVGFPWLAYDDAVGEVRLAAGNVDQDAADELIGAQGTYPTNGGNAFIWDDGVAQFAGLGWVRYPYLAYRQSNGELFPTVGNLR